MYDTHYLVQLLQWSNVVRNLYKQLYYQIVAHYCIAGIDLLEQRHIEDLKFAN